MSHCAKNGKRNDKYRSLKLAKDEQIITKHDCLLVTETSTDGADSQVLIHTHRILRKEIDVEDTADNI